MKNTEFVSKVIDYHNISLTDPKILPINSGEYYSLIFNNNGKTQLYINHIPYFLGKGAYTVLRPGFDAKAVSTADSNTELCIFRFWAENTQSCYFSGIVFQSNKEQLLILKKMIADMQSCRFTQNDFKGSIIKELVSEITVTELNQFFLEGKRLLIYSENIQCGALQAELHNHWERYNARNRHYLEILNNANFAPRKKNNTLEITKAEEIAEYINQNYMSNITLDDIVRHFNFSKTYICRIFKNHFSKTVLDYQNNLKMQAAKDLLLQQKYSITQISNMMNYSSVHYFSASFKNYYNISPRAFLSQNE